MMMKQEIVTLIKEINNAVSLQLNIREQYDSLSKLRDYLKEHDFPAEDWQYYFATQQERDQFILQAVDIFSRFEIVRAQDYLKDKDALPKSAHERNTLVQDEIEFLKSLGKIKSDSKVCFVGAGGMPTSTIGLISNHFKVVSVDCDPVAVSLGKEVLAKLYPDEDHVYDTCFSSNYNYASYDVIWVANFLTHKKETLQKIMNDRQGAETIIIVRDTPGLKGIIHLPVTHDDIPASFPKEFLSTPVSATRVNTSRVYICNKAA